MKNLICKIGLLCAVLLGIIDTSFAQSFSVQRVGNGKQAIILIPGFACSGEVWEQTVDSLQNNYSCYILTMPGFAGVSPEKNPSFDSWAKQIIEFIKEENIKNPILIGHSMGGGLALYIASSQPNLVKSMVTIPIFRLKKLPPKSLMSLNPNCARWMKSSFTGKPISARHRLRVIRFGMTLSSNGACRLTERLTPICIMSIPT